MIHCEGITQELPKSTWNTSPACGESISGCSVFPAQQQKRYVRLRMASTSMCSSQTSVSYCLVEHPAPLRRSCYTYGHGRGRIWYRCRRLHLSPPHWKCNVVLMTHPPARRKIDSWAPVEAKARVKAGVHACLCLASQIEHLVPRDAIFGHVWCIWSRCVHVWTRQRAGLMSEARLRVGRPWVKLWALRW